MVSESGLPWIGKGVYFTARVLHRDEMLCGAEGQGHDGEDGVEAAVGDVEGGVYHIEVVVGVDTAPLIGDGGAGIVALVTAAVGYMIGRNDGRVAASRIEPELSELLLLLRQTAPALVQQGKISELRWATIKIMLSRYDI